MPAATNTRDPVAEAERVVALIDGALTRQVNAILHHPRFQAMEALWLGVAMILRVAGNNPDVKVKLWNVSWRELAKNIDRATEFDQTRMFELVYGEEFGTPGGEPFGLIVADYPVGPAARGADTVSALASVAATAAAAFCPVVLGAAPEVFDVDDYAALDRVVDLSRAVIEAPQLSRWDVLRRREDTRFIGLAAPRILMRPPRGGPTRRRRDGFLYEEAIGPNGEGLVWGNAAFAVAAVVTRHFMETGWFADLRGAPQDSEGGGLVPAVRAFEVGTDGHGLSSQPPVEIRLTALQEQQFAEAGVIAIGTLYLSDRLVLNTNPSLHRPQPFDRAVASQNARIAAMLQYVMCASRFAHYLKVIMRDSIGRAVDVALLERRLNDWLAGYCLGNDDADIDLRARFPLRSAHVDVRDLPGRPGAYACTIHLQPHFQLDDIATSFQLVAETADAVPGAIGRTAA